MTSRARVSRVVLASIAAAASACFIDRSVPDGADIACAIDEDCPGELLCQPASGKCVDSASLDADPPGFQALPVIEPPVAGAGTTLTITFDVSEQLIVDPIVVLDRDPAGGGGDVALTTSDATVRGSAHFVYAYVAQADEPEGALPISITMVDNAGNIAQSPRIASFVFDFTGPQLAAPASLSTTTARDGDVVTLAFVLDEPVKAPPVVTMSAPGGAAIEWARAPDDADFPLAHFYTVGVDAAVAAGNYTIVVAATDEAGNELDDEVATLTVE